MRNDLKKVNGVSRRRILQTGAVTVTTLSTAGVAAASGGGSVTKQTSNVMGPSLVLAEDPDELPSYGIGLLDDRVAISCYEQDSGTVQAVIDTGVPKIRDWANSIYVSYRSDAQPIESQRIIKR